MDENTATQKYPTYPTVLSICIFWRLKKRVGQCTCKTRQSRRVRIDWPCEGFPLWAPVPGPDHDSLGPHRRGLGPGTGETLTGLLGEGVRVLEMGLVFSIALRPFEALRFAVHAERITR
ncbi:hypothetical protein GGTG_07520 [Gaeumannomyces tritici R3-111a-1]|uniref:Uncharacterized protein n=1 Tax=Gaeumannomyces tritici (strain R3-111a-1) TaxID=644352 RepID=J3P1X2_GAET3|nr:hypothetical protein GGTG_07520 [Gaeumannomyces tritici R3-111a-1]EJT73664.1 hypothetical protein GGTG_07520 [Gaeumannomyces tritici R3-111a-1]